MRNVGPIEVSGERVVRIVISMVVFVLSNGLETVDQQEAHVNISSPT